MGAETSEAWLRRPWLAVLALAAATAATSASGNWTLGPSGLISARETLAQLERSTSPLSGRGAAPRQLGVLPRELNGTQRVTIVELEDPDGVLNIPQDSFLIICDLPIRGLQTSANASKRLVPGGAWVLPLAVQMAALAWENGIVVRPGAPRLLSNIVIVIADVCKDDPSGVGRAKRCNSMYSGQLLHNLLVGSPVTFNTTAPPPVRAMVGLARFATFTAYTAGYLGIPSIGFIDKSDAMADRDTYPTYMRTTGSVSSMFSGMLAILQFFNVTLADLVVCNTPTALQQYTPVVLAFESGGISTGMIMIEPFVVSALPAGSWQEQLLAKPVSISTKKGEEWRNVLSKVKARNAHFHVRAMLANIECPEMDAMSNFGLGGLVGAGHVWIGFDFAVDIYQMYIRAVLHWTLVFGVPSPFLYVKGLDGDIHLQTWTPQGPAFAEFHELLSYMLAHADQMIPSWISSHLQDDEVLKPILFSALYAYNLFDAVYTVLQSAAGLDLQQRRHQGPSVSMDSHAELLQAMLAANFDGVSGQILFSSSGERTLKYEVYQYNIDPAVTQLADGMAAEDRFVGEFFMNLTWVAPLIFYGGSRVAPLSYDRVCSPGRFYERTGGTCAVCEAGRSSSRKGASVCELCPPGSYAAEAGSSVCSACSKGSAMSGYGATECTKCAPGTFMHIVQQPVCLPCPSGAFSLGAAEFCEACPRGTFVEDSGQTGCAGCPYGMTTKLMGSSTQDACACPTDSYLSKADRAVCHPCPLGMSCALGSDELGFDTLAAHSQDVVLPQARIGYMTLPSSPLHSYLCATVDDCPGGLPATCGYLRDVTAVACARCVEGAHPSKGGCSPCTGHIQVHLLVIAILVGILVLVVFVVVANRDPQLQSHNMMAVGIVIGITVTSMQTMGVFRSLSLPWFEPLRSIFEALQVLSFDLKVLQLACYMRPNVVMMFGLQQVAHLAIALVLLLLVLARRYVLKRPIHVVPVYINSAGTVFSSILISMATSIALPLRCYSHPHGDESVSSEPSILCWQTVEHHQLVVIAAMSLLTSVLPVAALIVFGTVMHQRFVVQGTTGKSLGLNAFRFLHFRFRQEAYYYVSVLVVRSFLIVLVPVVIRHDVAFQVCVMATILLGFLVWQLYLQPWRCEVTNLIDGFCSAGLLFLLICGIAGADFSAEQNSIKLLAMLAFVVIVVVVVVAAGLFIWKRFRPNPWFQWFICHHKRDAAGQARMLKSMLNQHRQTCFIDSDHLQNLDLLFDVVKYALKTLIIYLTPDVLTRPWCAGEISTAFKRGLSMVCIETPSWQPPGAAALDELHAYLDLSSMSPQQYFISFDSIAVAYAYALGPKAKKISMAENVLGREKFHRIVSSLLGKGGAWAPQALCPGAVAVASDPANDEATAAAAILISKLQPGLLSFADAGLYMLADEESWVGETLDLRHVLAETRALIVILSAGSLESRWQLRVIAEGMRRLKRNRGSMDRCEATLSISFSWEVIPVTLSNFQFPHADSFSHKLPILWSAQEEEYSAVKSFFKYIAVLLSTEASDEVLNSQAMLVLRRIPRQHQGGGHNNFAPRASMDAVGALLRSGVGRALSGDWMRTARLSSDSSSQAGASARLHPSMPVNKDMPTTISSMPDVSAKDTTSQPGTSTLGTHAASDGCDLAL